MASHRAARGSASAHRGRAFAAREGIAACCRVAEPAGELASIREHVVALLGSPDAADAQRGAADDLRRAAGGLGEREARVRFDELAALLVAGDKVRSPAVLAGWLQRYRAAEQLLRYLAGDGALVTNAAAAKALHVTAAAISRQAAALAEQGLLIIQRRGRTAEYLLTQRAREALALVPFTEQRRKQTVTPPKGTSGSTRGSKIVGGGS